MSDEKENDSSKKPKYGAYAVRESKDGKGFWNTVGAGWEHRDGQGIDVRLDSIPLDGRVALRVLREERMNAYDNERKSDSSERSSERKESRDRSR